MAADLIPAAMRRADPPALPELSEPEVQRHYLRLSQETQGMMNISLFGTCTMKYHSRAAEQAAQRWLAELHPLQPEDTLQGVLAAIHGFDLILRELSGMDQFVFQAGGGADAAYTHAVVTRAWLQAKGRARAARRDRHLDPGPSLQCRHRGCRGLQGGDADAGGGRLPVHRGAQGCSVQPHRGLDDQQPGRHGHLQPAHQRVGADRPRGRRARLLRPRQLQRRHGQDPGSRARLRRLHVHAAQDLRRPQGRRRARRRRLWLLGRAGAVPAGAGGGQGG